MKVALLAAVLLAQEAGPYDTWKNGPPRDPGFFPLAVWLQNPRNAPRYKEAGINVYVGLYRGPTAEQLAALRAAGMKVVCGQGERGLAFKDDPTIIAWMHGDEPDNAQPKPGGGWGPPVATAKVVEDYVRMREADPTRPVFLNLGQGVAYDNYIGRGVRRNKMEDYPEYLKGCDIASFDIYPVVHESPEIAGKLWYVPRGVQRLREWTGDRKVVWNCIEAARIDNLERKPTAAQVRTEVWMSLIHGSRGIIYFVHQFKPVFREASLLDDADLLRGVAEINREIRQLAPVLNRPTMKDGVAVTVPDPEAPVAAMVKRHEETTYLFAVAMREKAVRAAFALKDGPREGTAEALGEGRSIPVRDGRFEDDFKPYEVHLYRVK